MGTISTLQHHSRLVDEEVDMICMTREAEFAETRSVIANMNSNLLRTQGNLPCHFIPYGLSPQFLERSEEMARIRNALDPIPNKGDENHQLRYLHICGIGGAGKSQLALHYANSSTELFDVIIWIPAATHIKVSQAIAEFASKLGLPGNDAETKDEAMQTVRVKDWLNTSGRSFLLVFDDVQDLSTILPIWPSSGLGSILMTSRLSYKELGARPTVFRLELFTSESSQQVISTLTGMPAVENEGMAALSSICKLSGGLPLSVVQVSNLIREQEYTYEDFLVLYKQSAARIYEKGGILDQYNHTPNVLWVGPSTIWAMALEKLPTDSETLLTLLAFFDPDVISERLLTNKRASLEKGCFGFLADDSTVSDNKY